MSARVVRNVMLSFYICSVMSSICKDNEEIVLFSITTIGLVITEYVITPTEQVQFVMFTRINYYEAFAFQL